MAIVMNESMNESMNENIARQGKTLQPGREKLEESVRDWLGLDNHDSYGDANGVGLAMAILNYSIRLFLGNPVCQS